MLKISAYLGFNGQCREAMEFYKECLGGELQLMPYEGSPMMEGQPEENKDHIMHAYLSSDDIILMGSDMGGDSMVPGTNVSICLHGDYEATEKITDAFNKLSAGATVTGPLKEEFFGMYGDLTDKYGFRWMFQSDAKPA